jgi:hypothetical protein
MWKNNHINLWNITKNISHKIRNIFDKNKKIRVSKRIIEKIKSKHPECFDFLIKENFQILLKNSFSYFQKWKNYNFFCKNNNEIIIIWLQKQQNHISIHTIFKINKTRYFKYLELYELKNF